MISDPPFTLLASLRQKHVRHDARSAFQRIRANTFSAMEREVRYRSPTRLTHVVQSPGLPGENRALDNGAGNWGGVGGIVEAPFGCGVPGVCQLLALRGRGPIDV